MIKQVDKMPTKGKFVAVWGHANADELYWRGDHLRYFKGDCVVGDSMLEKMQKEALFFAPAPTLTPISFDWPWQVEQWLCANQDKKLFVKSDEKSDFVIWDNCFKGGRCYVKNSGCTVKYNYGRDGSIDRTDFYYVK